MRLRHRVSYCCCRRCRYFTAAVLRRRGGAAAPVSEDDVLRAIDRLRVLGGGWSVHQIAG